VKKIAEESHAWDKRERAQMQLPMFPAGVGEINSRLAVEKRDGQVYYLYGVVSPNRRKVTSAVWSEIRWGQSRQKSLKRTS
jgi:hypothetical protein